MRFSLFTGLLLGLVLVGMTHASSASAQGVIPPEVIKQNEACAADIEMWVEKHIALLRGGTKNVTDAIRSSKNQEEREQMLSFVKELSRSHLSYSSEECRSR